MLKIADSNSQKFQTKKRTMVRIADQMRKRFNSDVFIVIHQRDTNQITSHATDVEFDLAKVVELMRKDVEYRISTRKVEHYLNIDYKQLTNKV